MSFRLHLGIFYFLLSLLRFLFGILGNVVRSTHFFYNRFFIFTIGNISQNWFHIAGRLVVVSLQLTSIIYAGCLNSSLKHLISSLNLVNLNSLDWWRSAHFSRMYIFLLSLFYSFVDVAYLLFSLCWIRFWAFFGFLLSSIFS